MCLMLRGRRGCMSCLDGCTLLPLALWSFLLLPGHGRTVVRSIGPFAVFVVAGHVAVEVVVVEVVEYSLTSAGPRLQGRHEVEELALDLAVHTDTGHRVSNFGLLERGHLPRGPYWRVGGHGRVAGAGRPVRRCHSDGEKGSTATIKEC